LPFQTRRPHRALTARERRREVVGILATALARMPQAVRIPHSPAAEDSPESSQKALEVSGRPRLSVGGG